jgi:rare lipoprotein A
MVGCSSTGRFTSTEKNNHYPPVKNEKEVISSSVSLEEDEYNKMPVLESEVGIASYYSDDFNGRKTASGDIYNKNELTAAHLNYPFNTVIRVLNLLNNKSVIVRINDRRPDFNGRIIDLSRKAAEVLGLIKKGISKVKLEVLKWGDK